MNILNAIVKHWDIITLILAAILVIVFAVFRGNKGVVMRILYAAVTQAEREFGSGTGSLKLAAVIEAVYPKLPAVVKLFVTAERLTKWIELALVEAKRAWETNSNIAAYIDKPPNGQQDGAQQLASLPEE